MRYSGHVYIAEYEALPEQARERLLAAIREIGADCARRLYERGTRRQYFVSATAEDLDALRKVLRSYGIKRRLPPSYRAPWHPIWGAFWLGVRDVPEPNN
jgi:hypothetical protein